jgi:hypothetical protein
MSIVGNSEPLFVIVPQSNYVLQQGFWIGQMSREEGWSRDHNPYVGDEVNRLAWLIGWDERDQLLRSLQCAPDDHQFDELYESGEICLICRASRKTRKDEN